MKKKLASLLLLAVCLSPSAKANSENTALSKFVSLKNASMMVIGHQQQSFITYHSDKLFIPASTTKLATAWMALSHWGEHHHFKTRFYYDPSNQTLWVKGSGDPFLVSEELALIASKLKQIGLQKVDRIGLDHSLFQSDLILPGTEKTDNPYDAVPTAIAANFNSIKLIKKQGIAFSAETQTPLTDYARKLSTTLVNGKFRINTGSEPRNAERYFAELLAAFLRKQNIAVKEQIIHGTVPDLSIFYSHRNSKSLAEIIRAMMKYSTNFVANQLILILSAETFHRPANATDVKLYMEQTLARRFNWQQFTLEDGAGLSRNNRLSASQLIELLEAFRPWKHLLPEVETNVYAKSGTLKGISTLAGFIVSKNQWEPFALMMNEKVPYRFKNRLAEELVELKKINNASSYPLLQKVVQVKK